jgi:tRNA threonylcarbamoyl adenosine modification protein (Sua5/YciO/YrdC/YwlC family)
MSEKIVLDSQNFAGCIDRALISILRGGIVVVAAEHGYIYACDAFNQSSVAKIHQLRGDQPRTACQVMVGNSSSVPGVAQDFDEQWQKLAEKFWPGLLTMQLMQQPALSWDLGDAGSLAEFALRVPSSGFLQKLLEQTGPLAVASAAPTGQGVLASLSDFDGGSDIAVEIDEGLLPAGPLSTVVRRSVIGAKSALEVTRVGAISLAQLQSVLPDISASSA